MARIYIVSSSLFVKGRLFAAARLEEERESAQQWRETHEQEGKADPVPALQDGALSDQAREVPAAHELGLGFVELARHD